MLHVPPGRWCNWEGVGDPLGVDGFIAGQAGLLLTNTPGRATMPHEWPVPWHRIRMADGTHNAPVGVTEAEEIAIVAITADWWEAECRQHDPRLRVWRIRGVAYDEERKWSIAQWVADEKRVGRWPWGS